MGAELAGARAVICAPGRGAPRRVPLPPPGRAAEARCCARPVRGSFCPFPLPPPGIPRGVPEPQPPRTLRRRGPFSPGRPRRRSAVLPRLASLRAPDWKFVPRVVEPRGRAEKRRGFPAPGEVGSVRPLRSGGLRRGRPPAAPGAGSPQSSCRRGWRRTRAR